MRLSIAATILVAMCLMGAGCGTNRVQPGLLTGELPSYDQVAAAYNTRVAPLERLWARTVVRLRFTDADGKVQNQQVEGHCQYIRPSKVLVSFHKAGHALAMLGSNEDRFWWIELGETKRAFVGTHAAATPDRIAAAGVRVHPLDLMELFGLTALPASGEGSAVSASPDGRSVVVTVPGRWLKRRLYLDPANYRPSRIELVDDHARVNAFAELARYQTVALKAAPPGTPRAWVATDIRVEVESGGPPGSPSSPSTRIIMELSEPQNDPARFPKSAFDFDRLIEAHGVVVIQDLDRDERTPVQK